MITIDLFRSQVLFIVNYIFPPLSVLLILTTIGGIYSYALLIINFLLMAVLPSNNSDSL